ncbi:hypothetical protein Hanom_Chr10g00938461 [Helianthus anomalus]
MDNEFYNAFAGPMNINQNALLENETGTSQKPPKLMDIDDYNAWFERFGNWVEAYHLDAWDHTEEPYEKPTRNGKELTVRAMNVDEKKKYRDEKLMVSLLQQAIKEDILILLQHDGSAYSIWTELEAKSIGSDDMVKNKKSLMKKEFDLFRGLKSENTKQIIERYCNLVRNMSKLGIKKDTDELIEKLADALPHEIWGTFLMMLRNNRKEYKKLTLGEFIKHLEAQEMEQRKIARMKNYDGEQDISLYFKSGVTEKTNLSPKGSSSNTSFSSFPSFDLNISATKNGRKLQCNIVLNLENDQDSTEEVAKNHMSLLGMVLESYSSFVAGKIGNPMLTKEDYNQIDAEEMELMDIKWCLAIVLRRAEKFKEKGHFKRECTNRKASGAQNPFNNNNDYYRKAIYHQVAQQQQVPHQAQTAHGRNVLEDSKRACLINQGKDGGFSWDKYISMESKVCLGDQDDEKLVEGFCWDNFCPDQEYMAKEMSKDTSNVKAFIANAYDLKWVEKCRKVREAAEEKQRQIEKEEEEEERLKSEAEAEKKRRVEFFRTNRTVKDVPEFEISQNNDLLHNIKRLKESYDTMNREINKYTESNCEQVVAMNTLKGAYIRQLDDVNFYTKKCAELELKLETQRIETERVKNLLESYSCSTFVVDRIYPIVESLKTFEEKKTSKEKKSETEEDNDMSAPVENGYSPRKPNSERVKKAINLQWESGPSDNLPKNIDVTYTSSDTDHESKLIKSVVDQVLDKDDSEESKPESKSESKSKPESKSVSDTSKPTIKKDKRVYDT